MTTPATGACTKLRLPFEETSVAVARRTLGESLTGAAVSERAIQDAQLVLSELVTNSVKHGKPCPDFSIEVCWCMDESLLRVCVTDAGQATQVTPRDPGPDALSGRGLSIVDMLCESWEVHSDGGTRMTARLALV